MQKRHFIILGSVAAIVLVSFLSFKILSGMKETTETRPETDIKRYVKATQVVYSDINSEVIAAGRVTSQQFIDLSSEVQGKILQGSIPLKTGQKFSKGQLLARIYSDDFEYGLKAKKSKFLNLIANLLPDFKIDYPNSYADWLTFFEKIDIDKALPDLPAVKSSPEKIYLASRNILSEFYGIKSDELRLSKYALYAPFSGSFSVVYLEVGAIANPGVKLAQMIQTDLLELEVPVEVTSAKWIQVGQAVTVQTQDGQEITNGKVVRKSDFVDPQSQSINVYIGLQSTSNTPVYKGQYLQARFTGASLQDVMEIPRNAVFNFNEVFTVQNGRLKKEQIEIIKINNSTLIFKGLDEGVNVITEPLVNASENVAVEIIQ